MKINKDFPKGHTERSSALKTDLPDRRSGMPKATDKHRPKATIKQLQFPYYENTKIKSKE